MKHTLWLIALLIFTAPTKAGDPVQCGIDVLVATNFSAFKNQSIVLVTHAAARSLSGKSSAEEFIKAGNVKLLRLLTPEHGYYGVVQAGLHVGDETVLGHSAVSLYGPRRRPSREMLAGADAVVIDMQDIGVRSYTYISTMTEVMDACAEYNVRCVILDRPNPLGDVVDGNIPDDTVRSFICRLPVPYVHGMTMGELATMANNEGWLSLAPLNTSRKCSLSVVACKNLYRAMSWEQTGRSWFPTSPNIPSVASARGYALTGLLGELGVYSIGIGTTSPFSMIGSPSFMADSAVTNILASQGITAATYRFKPSGGKYSGSLCQGWYLLPTQSWKPYRAATTLLWWARSKHPEAFPDTLQKTRGGIMFHKACGSGSLVRGLVAGDSLRDLLKAAEFGIEGFLQKRTAYLLYD